MFFGGNIIKKKKLNWIVIGVLLVLILVLLIGIVVSEHKSGEKADNKVEENTGLTGTEDTDETEDEFLNPDASQSEEKNDPSDKKTESSTTQSGTGGQNGSLTGNDTQAGDDEPTDDEPTDDDSDNGEKEAPSTGNWGNLI